VGFRIPKRLTIRISRARARRRQRRSPENRALSQFVSQHRNDLSGRVLETERDEWTRRFGGPNVRTVSVLSANPRNRVATHVADLSANPSLPHAAFDCVLITDTRSRTSAIPAALNALEVGGVLLAAFDARHVPPAAATATLTELLPASSFTVAVTNPLTTVRACRTEG
jgi:hypothetical protein